MRRAYPRAASTGQSAVPAELFDGQVHPVGQPGGGAYTFGQYHSGQVQEEAGVSAYADSGARRLDDSGLGVSE